MKQFISDIGYDFIHHVNPKWKYFLSTGLTIGIIDFIFYTLTHSPVVTTSLDNKIIFSFDFLFNIGIVYSNFREYVQKDYLKLKRETMQNYLDEVILKDENMSKLYNSTAEHRRGQLVSILFGNAILEESNDK